MPGPGVGPSRVRGRVRPGGDRGRVMFDRTLTAGL